jgi:glycosyltransferase involved in cell wall biosynthesis
VKIALAHDWLNQMGGAENVLEVLVEMFPRAPIFTTIYWSAGMPDRYRAWDIRTSWLDRLPGIYRHHQKYLPFYPVAVRSLDLSEYDLVLSNKSGFIHGLRTRPGQIHLCYCLTPTRFVWDFAGYAAREELSPTMKLGLRPLIRILRGWDRRSAGQVTHFAAISREIQARIEKYYGRGSRLIYPPVNIDRFQPNGLPPGGYYFIVSRLVPYKRIDLAVRAFTEMKKRLVIVGDGRDRQALEQIAGPGIEFRGRLRGYETARLMAGCRACVFPGYEDFGMAPLEAQACGRPVIAYARGGALDTVRQGETGLFFETQSVAALIHAVQRFEAMTFDPVLIRRHAKNFGPTRFKRELKAWIEESVGDSGLVDW